LPPFVFYRTPIRQDYAHTHRIRDGHALRISGHRRATATDAVVVGSVIISRATRQREPIIHRYTATTAAAAATVVVVVVVAVGTFIKYA